MSGKELDTPRQMIAKARIKIDSAQILLINGNYDDSVSRSYYAVFFAVSAALYSKGLSFSSHSQAIGAFNREFVKTGIFPPTFTKMIKLILIFLNCSKMYSQALNLFIYSALIHIKTILIIMFYPG